MAGVAAFVPAYDADGTKPAYAPATGDWGITLTPSGRISRIGNAARGASYQYDAYDRPYLTEQWDESAGYRELPVPTMPGPARKTSARHICGIPRSRRLRVPSHSPSGRKPSGTKAPAQAAAAHRLWTPPAPRTAPSPGNRKPPIAAKNRNPSKAATPAVKTRNGNPRHCNPCKPYSCPPARKTNAMPPTAISTTTQNVVGLMDGSRAPAPLAITTWPSATKSGPCQTNLYCSYTSHRQINLA